MTPSTPSRDNLLGQARARAGTNIALVKYWGKRDPELNLPAAGSLSLTLEGLGSETEVRFFRRVGAPADRITLNGAPADAATARRIGAFLDLVRAQARLDADAVVETTNTVPTASGLASSASGFAALALAATRAAGISLEPRALSALARRGSGSAARSIFGGLVAMSPGQAPDGSDATAEPLLGPEVWPLRLCIAITSDLEKPLSSTAAMNHTAATSPYYAEWLRQVPADLAEARSAIAARDLPRLGTVTERSCLRMHASALAADPGILYWNGATVAAIHAVRALRQSGAACYFTIDAGPHVKALCLAPDADRVQRKLAKTPGVLRTMVVGPGPDAQLLEVTA